MRTSRMKDYFDVRVLLRSAELDTAQLARAIAATFTRRRTALPSDIPAALSDPFANDPAKSEIEIGCGLPTPEPLLTTSFFSSRRVPDVDG